MLHYPAYIKSVITIISLYKGEEPLSGFLKKYFSAHKKFGSKDRKQITLLCYNFYRLGKSLPEMPTNEKVILATFLCNHYEKEFILLLKDDWMALAHKSLPEKLNALGIDPKTIFPFADALSREIEHEVFCLSYFVQPKLFLRHRQMYLRWELVEKLKKAEIDFTWESTECLSFKNGTKLDEVLAIGEEVIVQDYTSQQTLNYVKQHGREFKQSDAHTWDCCAASGGKTILFSDNIGRKTKITVSDIRLSILNNLHQRFRKAGITDYDYFVCDLAKKNSPFPDIHYSTIICDVPCTGSGTWGRTPEQLYFFKEDTVSHYTNLQRKIITHALPQLRDGGYFFYITCSVFAAENELQVDFIKNKFHLQLLQTELLKGYDKQADTMFVAVFKKNN